MADNPLFPGYIPRKEGDTPNPLFPGYSQGQRAYKPPTGVPLEKYEYNTDYWLEQLDQMSFDAGNLPKWFLDRYVDDFKSNLRAVYSPETVPVEQMDDYDQDVMPGVSGISLTLDPKEWQEPDKVLEKTAKSWIKAGTGLRFQKKGWGLEAWPIDLTDYDTNVRTTLWKAAMGLQSEISPLGMEGGRSIASATRAIAGDKSQGDRLFNFSEADYVVSGKRGYDDMSEAAVESVRYMKAGPKRDSKHDAFLAAMAASMKEELDGGKIPELDAQGNILLDQNGDKIFKKVEELDSQGRPLLNDKGEKIFKKTTDRDGNIVDEFATRKDLFAEVFTDATEKENFKKAVAVLAAKQQLASDIGIKKGAILEKFGVVGFLQARLTNDPTEGKRGELPETDPKYLGKTRFEARLAKLREDIQEQIGLTELGVATGNGKVDGLAKKLIELDKNDLGLKAMAGEVQKYGDMYKDYLSQVLTVINQYEGKEIVNGVVKNVSKISDRELYNKLININVKGKGITEGGLFDTSIQRGLLRQIESDIILPGKFGKVDKRLQIGTYLAKLERESPEQLEALFKERGLEYKGFFANQARIVASRLELDRSSYAIQEFYDAVTEGKFMERYVWNKLSKTMTGYTPGEILQQGLTRVGYFGLKIDDAHVSQRLRNNETFNNVFRYKFDLKIKDEEHVFGKGDQVVLKGIAGSKDLAGVAQLSGLLDLKNHLEKNELLDVIIGRDKDGKLSFLFDKNGAVAKKFDDKVVGWWKSDPYQGQFVQKQIDTFREWLRKNKDTLGFDIDNMSETDREKLFLLFTALNKENKFYGSLSITTEYAGALQRIGMKLNILQDKIFGNELFKRIIRPALQIKTIVAEKISDLVATLIAEFATKFLHAATGGATAAFDYLIEKVLKPLVRFITRKVVEFGQNFVGAIAQGDISKAMTQIDKEIAQVVKFSMYVIGVPLILIYVLVYGLFGTVLSSISPIDPTRDNSGYGGTGAGLPQGENALIKIEKDVVVTFSDGATETNPVGSIENSELGITVNYIIKITPKVSIEGESVIFSDVVTKITTNGEQTVTTLADNQNLGTFTAGETYTVISDPVSIGSGFENSLVKNTLSVDTPAFQGTDAETVTFVRYLRIGTPPVPMDCFVFSGFSGNELANFEASLWNISGITGTFLSTLCSDDRKITLSRVSGGGDYCGFASGTGVITFNDTCTSYYTRLNATSYLLAHELGHIYNFWRLSTSTAVPGFPGGFDSVKGLEGGLTLPTYDGNCTTNNSVGEDFAETIGDMVAINSFGSCSATASLTYPLGDYDAFWNKFPVHRRFAQEVIFVR